MQTVVYFDKTYRTISIKTMRLDFCFAGMSMCSWSIKTKEHLKLTSKFNVYRNLLTNALLQQNTMLRFYQAKDMHIHLGFAKLANVFQHFEP